MQRPLRRQLPLAAAVLLGLVASAAAHGHDEESMDIDMSSHSMSRPTILPASNATAPESYFQLKEHSAWLLAHIVLMTLDWVFILPIGVMLSISRSRFTLLIQFVFLVVNAIAVLLVTVYNARTPDLYSNNAHHKLGWLVTWVVGAQFVMGVLFYYTGATGRRHSDERRSFIPVSTGPMAERQAFIPVSTAAMAEHERYHRSASEIYRFSNDSGQGTEPTTESLRSQSVSSQSSQELQDVHLEPIEDPDVEKMSLLQGSKLDRFLSQKIPGLLSLRLLRVFRFLYAAVDRLILLVGYAVLVTGFVTYGGLFMGDKIYSGLAHFIKGGVFFWYGILTLGRWAGCFADIGWAWNINPSTKPRPSAEFVESFLIFFYGATNIFLEHLAAWGHAWSAQDLEHLSITIMFIGGGLCGMLISSPRIRSRFNRTIALPSPSPVSHPSPIDPAPTNISPNPLPALIILLLGLTMSSHHQDSMVSTMLHKQWGLLLSGAAFARVTTYLLLYVRPPASTAPGRLLTEVICGGALVGGGVVFGCSARDVVESIELYGIDAMVVFTVAMGVVLLLMAWVIAVVAIMGWVAGLEERGTGRVGRRRRSAVGEV